MCWNYLKFEEYLNFDLIFTNVDTVCIEIFANI